MSDKCFKKCVSSPGSSLGNSETVRTFQRNNLNDKWVNAGHIQVLLSENRVCAETRPPVIWMGKTRCGRVDIDGWVQNKGAKKIFQNNRYVNEMSHMSANLISRKHHINLQ